MERGSPSLCRPRPHRPPFPAARLPCLWRCSPGSTGCLLGSVSPTHRRIASRAEGQALRCLSFLSVSNLRGGGDMWVFRILSGSRGQARR